MIYLVGEGIGRERREGGGSPKEQDLTHLFFMGGDQFYKLTKLKPEHKEFRLLENTTTMIAKETKLKTLPVRIIQVHNLNIVSHSSHTRYL